MQKDVSMCGKLTLRMAEQNIRGRVIEGVSGKILRNWGFTHYWLILNRGLVWLHLYFRSFLNAVYIVNSILKIGKKWGNWPRGWWWWSRRWWHPQQGRHSEARIARISLVLWMWWDLVIHYIWVSVRHEWHSLLFGHHGGWWHIYWAGEYRRTFLENTELLDMLNL